jgi:hypothetical protein
VARGQRTSQAIDLLLETENLPLARSLAPSEFVLEGVDFAQHG